MKRLAGLFSLVLLFVLLLPSSASMQETPVPLRLELSGVNPIELPRVEVTANVYDALGQPVPGLTAEQFRLSGPLAEVARIVDVQNVASAELPYATVLVIDASDSMEGAPIDQAIEAARLFVANVRDIDPVAVVAFGSTVRVLQDFTTDKDALNAAIESITLLGRTALWQAAYDGADLALNGAVPRRAMVLLSDGSEYGGMSTMTAGEAVEHAMLNGVPSYTIGLGFGADRAFLEQLAAETLAQFYESPTPDELGAIYTALADRLSSQYILTLEVDAPLDGTEYPFELTVEYDGQTATQAGSVRAPIPVPVVDLSGVPAGPIDQLTEITVDVRADQDLESVTMALGGEVAGEFTEPPFTVSVDPAAFPPGPLALDVTAVDGDGDRGTGTASLEIAALPPVISLSRDVAEMGAIPEPLELTVNAYGQTPVTEVRLAINRGEQVVLEPPYTFVLDPLQLPPGGNHFDVYAVNESGLESVYPADFIIADVPPVVGVSGLTAGQTIDAPVTFSADVQSQTGLTDVSATIYGVPLPVENGVFTLDPAVMPPGATEVIVSATTEAGLTNELSVPITIAALPPTVTLTGLEDGATVTANLELTIDALGQTPAVEGSVVLDGEEAAHPFSFPAAITLPLTEMQPGENTLSITVEIASGQSGTLNLVFTVPPSLFTPTPTPTETPNVPATGTASAFAAATRTSVAQQAADAASTQAAATEAQATADQALALQATEAQATETGAAQAAQIARTTTAQAAVTNTPVPPRATATSVPASSTPQPAATATTADQPAANMRATADAAATFVLQAATRAFATVEAQSAATRTAVGAATEAAQTATAASRQAATEQAQTEAAASATAAAEAEARAGNRTATAQARATTQANAGLTATALASELLTATAQVGRTATQQAAATTSARANATSTAGAAQAATQDSGTQAASTANAQAADATSTADSARVAATDSARVTRTARATLAAQTATAVVEATAAAQNVTPLAPTPQPTLTPVEAESSAANSTTSVLWLIFALIVLMAIVLVLWVTRARKRRMNGE